MANPGTALTKLWTGSDVARGGKNDIEKSNSTSANEETKDLKQFYRDHGLGSVAAETGVVQSEKSNIVTIDPSSIVALEQVACSGLTNLSAITVKVTSNNSNGGGQNVSVATPIILTPSMLLPKSQTPTRTQQSTVQRTPNKVPPTLPSPSPSHAWSSSTPVRKRRTDVLDSLENERKRRRTPTRSNEKGGKGLRHFSMKVCEKVQQKGTTTYNEVADELVREFSETEKQSSIIVDQSYDQKNIRRRVYDALNVLMAMNIITKEKKEIKWVGLPTNSAQECTRLEEQKQEMVERIKQKQQQLQELVLQQVAFKSLVERNKTTEAKNGPPVSNSSIHLPFIIVNTSKKTVIDCSISSDKSEYLFNFDSTFEIHDDIEVLKRMGLTFGLEKGTCPEETVKVVTSLLPKSLEGFVSKMAKDPSESEFDSSTFLSSSTHQSVSSPLATPLNTIKSPGTSTSTTTSQLLTCNTQIASANNNIKSSRPATASSSFSDSCSEHETDASNDGTAE